jgi:hypothetical protein
MDDRPNLRYPIHYKEHEIWPDKQWQWSRDRVLEALKNDELVFNEKREKWTISYKQYLKDEAGNTRSQKPYSIVEGIYTQLGTQEIQKILGSGKAFSFPKPSELIKQLIQFSTDSGDLVLDSFAGSGTTGHAVLQLNTQDKGNRRFILVEMEPDISRNITAERLKRIIQGYTWRDQNGNERFEEGLSGGFQFCELGPTLFDAQGQIREEVDYNELAQHVFFTETGEPLTDTKGESPLIGVSKSVGVYLLYNGVLKDKSPQGGNVLTRAVLNSLPSHDGPKVIYGTGCLLSEPTLQRLGVTFRQIPYEVKVS